MHMLQCALLARPAPARLPQSLPPRALLYRRRKEQDAEKRKLEADADAAFTR
jgi:hypothetical protein